MSAVCNSENVNQNFFETAVLEWSTAVYNFHHTGKSYRQRMGHYYLIKGPINAVSTDHLINVESIQQLKDGKGRIGNQITVCTSDAAKSMNVKLVGVVFYPHMNRVF